MRILSTGTLTFTFEGLAGMGTKNIYIYFSTIIHLWVRIEEGIEVVPSPVMLHLASSSLWPTRGATSDLSGQYLRSYLLPIFNGKLVKILIFNYIDDFISK